MSPIISGGSGGASQVQLVFQSTLAAPAAAIDSGAVIPSSGSVLEVFFQGQSSTVAAAVALNLTFNNDTGANYDRQKVAGASVTASATTNLAATSADGLLHGNTGTTGYPGMARVVIPAYAGTTFFKTGEFYSTVIDGTAGNCTVQVDAVGWRSTAAITRVALTANSGNLAVGSSMFVYIR